jgi:hypothetical protein
MADVIEEVRRVAKSMTDHVEIGLLGRIIEMALYCQSEPHLTSIPTVTRRLKIRAVVPQPGARLWPKKRYLPSSPRRNHTPRRCAALLRKARTKSGSRRRFGLIRDHLLPEEARPAGDAQPKARSWSGQPWSAGLKWNHPFQRDCPSLIHARLSYAPVRQGGPR